MPLPMITRLTDLDLLSQFATFPFSLLSLYVLQQTFLRLRLFLYIVPHLHM
jgi:hypothetical protein